MELELQAAKVLAAKNNALEASDWLIFELAKADLARLMADENFDKWSFVSICKEQNVSWRGSI